MIIIVQNEHLLLLPYDQSVSIELAANMSALRTALKAVQTDSFKHNNIATISAIKHIHTQHIQHQSVKNEQNSTPTDSHFNNCKPISQLKLKRTGNNFERANNNLKSSNLVLQKRAYSIDKTVSSVKSDNVQVRKRSTTTIDEVESASSCPYTAEEFQTSKPYSEVPGPKPLPILGNTWRLIPYIGQYQISDLGKVSQILYDEYGEIVKMGGLVGRPDLLFLYDADEIEKIYRREGPTPFRPSMPCLVEYKSIVRKDFFGELAGVVGV